MRSSIGRGRTLDEAVDAALIELQESRRNVDVKILSETPEETVVEVAVIDQDAPSMGMATALLRLSSASAHRCISVSARPTWKSAFAKPGSSASARSNC